MPETPAAPARPPRAERPDAPPPPVARADSPAEPPGGDGAPALWTTQDSTDLYHVDAWGEGYVEV
ncbi:MAG TPA: hypothetical protein VF594_07855, partial [Rubricoccaceae bacterium]